MEIPSDEALFGDARHGIEPKAGDVVGEWDDAVEEQPGLVAHVEDVVRVIRGDLVDLDHLLHHEGNQHRQARTEDVVSVENTVLRVGEEPANIPKKDLIGKVLRVSCRYFGEIRAIE